jgi:3-hydroxyisobutyrate dehydrogenase-like beta-hydroxyacid dehydrogenase
MAANLARAGYPLVVHNRSPAKVEGFVADHEGSEAASTPR